MNVLMVYLMYPDKFWSFKHALKFVSKKASFPPLGLLTAAALLPKDWFKKLIDMNKDEGNFDDALECFSKAIELPPKDSVSYFNRASIKMYPGDVKGATSDLKALGTSGLIKILRWLYHIIIYLVIIILFL